MTHRVLVVGDANLDLILRGDVVPRFGQVEQLIDAAELVMGGSASIVATGLARLEVQVSLVAVVGDDEFGRIARETLGASGVDISAVRTAEGVRTGLSVILSGPNDRAILTDAGAIPLLTIEDVAAAVSSDVRWVHLASPFLVGGILDELPRLIRKWRASGIGISLDTNWDPSEQWLSVAPLIPLVDVLLPNRAELDAIAGSLGLTEGDPADAVTAIGPRVVVKDGAEGGFSVHAGVRVSAAGLSVGVVDTTGAGDSFDAGYLAAIAHGITEEAERLLWATTAGSLSTRGAGGTATQATLADIARP